MKFYPISANLLACSLLLAGCMDQNPLPSNTSLMTTAPAVSSSPSVTPTPAAPLLSLDAPQSVTFLEGRQGSFTVTPRVALGKPIISVGELPAGATFDPATYTFNWTPALGTGFDASSPEAYFKEYHVKFQIYSSTDLLTAVTRDVDVIVTSLPQNLDIDNGGIAMTAVEGTASAFTFKVVSPDFPKGPFNFSISPQLPGATIKQSDDDPSVFEYDFNPAYDFVKNSYGDHDYSQSGDSYVKTVPLTVTVMGPRSQRVSKSYSLAVQDKRLAPEVSAPNNLTFSYVAEFAISWADLNGETNDADAAAATATQTTSQDNQAPKADTSCANPFNELTFDAVPYGTVCIQDGAAGATVSPSKNPVHLANVTWKNVPLSQYGKPQMLTFHICANPDPAKNTYCTDQVVTLTFTGVDHRPPSVDRSAWSDGEIKNMRLGSTLQVPVAVADADDSSQTPDVTVMPAEMQNEVSYANGIVTVNPKATGVRIFQLISKSSYGVQAKESFTVRVYPKEWGKTLILEDASGREPEVLANQGIFDDTQLMDPALEGLTADSLILRDTVLFSTSLFKAIGTNSRFSANAMGQAFAKASSSVGRVIVSTPLIDSLPVPYLPSDLILQGRFLSLANHPALATLSVIPSKDSGFAAPQGPVYLGQKLTSESANPMIFNVQAGGACKVAMSLQSADGSYSAPVAVECVKPSGNKILFVGFEFGDLLPTSSDDEHLAHDWLQNWTSSQAAGGK